jgi:glycosyltransferase involved in cell wall biosynthesis
VRLHVLYEHSADGRPHGCSHIRLLLPLLHPANEGAWTVTSGTEYLGADVVVVERTWRPGITLEAAETLLDHARRDGACVVYSIDDNLLEAPSLARDQQMVVRMFAREAQGVLVSTGSLAERMRRLNEQVVVVPNAVDERLFPAGPPHRVGSRPLVVGYMGTFTHGADLMAVYQALRALARTRRGGVEFQMVGGTADPGVTRALDQIPVRVLSPGERTVYPSFVRWMTEHLRWDLAIAPLDDTIFNRAKSDIKFLDYGALGIPGVFSRVAAYAETVQDGQTGCLVENTVDAWYGALVRLVDAEEARWQTARTAHDHVMSRRTLAVCGRRWQEAITQIAERRARPPFRGEEESR